MRLFFNHYGIILLMAEQKFILIVDDEPAFREIFSTKLAADGFRVETAENGQIGIKKAKTLKPDLILMDMSLPIIDGWEATRRIKSDPDSKHIFIIGLTAHAMVGDREQAIKAGCDDYATKPVDFEKLIESIDRLVKRS